MLSCIKLTHELSLHTTSLCTQSLHFTAQAISLSCHGCSNFHFLPLAFLFTTAASQGQKNISLADTLTPTSKSSWFSPSGVFAFGFYQRGNGYYVGVFLPGTSNKTAVWTYGRDNPPLPSDSTLRFDSSGRLVLQSAQAQDAYVAPRIGTTASASMLDSGNFVLYDSSQGVIWQSFDWPTDTILGGQTLSAEQKLYSSASVTDPSTGLFLAIMQSDGVLALYPDGTPFTAEYGYWDSRTPDNGPNVTLRLEDDGFLYLLKPPSIYLSKFTNPGGPKEDMIYVARIDPDGLFRLYSYNTTRKDDWPAVWSVPSDRCSPKGICGLNGYCVNMDANPQCQCLPGFTQVKVGNGTAGCERNFTAESCKNPTASYDMQPVSITIWEDATYSALTSLTQDDCVEACRQDCNCEAVAYNASHQFCSKQKLPLRFGGSAGTQAHYFTSRGAFGTVYKGTLMKDLDSSKAVAVKKLQKISSDGESEFQVEVIVMIKRIGSWCMSTRAMGHLPMYSLKPKTNQLGCENGNSSECCQRPSLSTRRVNVDRTLPEEEVVLEEWVYSCFLAGELDKLVDYQTMYKKQLERMVKVALWCILEEPSLRPSMRKVLLMLEGTVDVPIPPCPISFLSVI
ncbi:hypothetical protein NL676_019647 [Syzygium grande]|nr:hypothetical protein NL676_019647 [Syzygium grande]